MNWVHWQRANALKLDQVSQSSAKSDQRGKLLQKKRHIQNGVACAKPHISKPRLTTNLIAVSASPKNAVFNLSLWDYLVSTSEKANRPLRSPLERHSANILPSPAPCPPFKT